MKSRVGGPVVVLLCRENKLQKALAFSSEMLMLHLVIKGRWLKVDLGSVEPRGGPPKHPPSGLSSVPNQRRASGDILSSRWTLKKNAKSNTVSDV